MDLRNVCSWVIYKTKDFDFLVQGVYDRAELAIGLVLLLFI